MAEKFWNRHNESDVLEFARYLNPLVIAAYPSKPMRDKHFGGAEARVYMLTLEDVPRDVLAEGVTRLLQEGVTWMPKPGDVKAACAAVVNERRKAALRQVRALTEDCPDCHGTGWANAEGPNAVIRCRCQTRAVELMNQVTAPIKVPQLPPAPEGLE